MSHYRERKFPTVSFALDCQDKGEIAATRRKKESSLDSAQHIEEELTSFVKGSSMKDVLLFQSKDLCKCQNELKADCMKILKELTKLSLQRSQNLTNRAHYNDNHGVPLMSTLNLSQI
ncbi:hypothetical protein T01_12935 [Trichinella spiralis]|uniref:Uncharacterized protein n=1 Tax=Trichinella spiralis TaxID=6334 RepID=A0A0V1BP08_TRISP|nr:hypothetical protein T01_12935 [Trichinella spiralis]